MTNQELFTALSSAESLPNALTLHFSYLADNDGFMPVLEKIMSTAQKVSLNQKSDLVVYFPDGKTLQCMEPRNFDYSAWPESFQKIMNKHYFLIYCAHQGSLVISELGDIGCVDADEWEEGGDPILELVDDPDDLLIPITDYSDCWVYHPVDKNPQGEPVLCLFDHGSCALTGETTNYNIGSLFLSKIAEKE